MSKMAALKLTKEQWRRVVTLRCRSAQGLKISKKDCRLIDAAFAEDQDRYRALEQAVVDERNAEYREHLKSMSTSALVRMLVDEEYRAEYHWQERRAEEELDARIPPRSP
jgi:hypothetical protein